MRKSIIREIFEGEKGTYEKIPMSVCCKNAEKDAYDAIDAFLELLNDEQKKSFDDVYMSILNRSAEFATDHFVEGVKVGLQIGLEIMDS